MTDTAHTATPDERALSASLIAAAIAVLVAALQVTFTSLQSLSGELFWGCLVFSILGLAALIASCVLGGQGMSYTHKAGPMHPFNWQAITLLVGTVLLIAVLIVATATIASQKKADAQTLAGSIEKNTAALQRVAKEQSSLETYLQRIDEANAIAAKERGLLSHRISVLEQPEQPSSTGNEK